MLNNMRLKTKLKLWYYNSFMSIFLISHFQIWCKFTLNELLEISLIINAIDWRITKLQELHDDILSYSFTLCPPNRETMNGITLWWIDKLGVKHEDETHVLAPQFNFNKHKWALWIC